jgi:RNA polymerase sigma-70 factor, ECF subfamily
LLIEDCLFVETASVARNTGAASKHHLGKPLREELRRNKMLSSVAYEINELGAGTVSFSDPAAEEALVAVAKRGDERAFEALVKHNQPRIFALALRYTRIHEDAEDVVQQTFQKAFVYLHNFEGKSSFSTWLTRIAINEALMLLRKGRAMREVSLDNMGSDEVTAPSLEMPDASPDPEAKYLQREGVRVLSMAIRRLTPAMRTVLELREFRELSARETARHLGLSVSAVKGRLFHGRRKIGEALKRYRRSPRMSSHSTLAIARSPNRNSQ